MNSIPIFAPDTLESMSRDRTDFGERLVRARKHAKLTQIQLSELVGMGQSTLAEAERIAHGSTFTARIAEATGVNPVWLEAGKGEMLAQNAQQVQGMSPIARELAYMFDQLPQDRIARTIAYNAATEVILRGIREHDAAPTPKPSSSVSPEKRHA